MPKLNGTAIPGIVGIALRNNGQDRTVKQAGVGFWMTRTTAHSMYHSLI
jgi:hypothetical protein